MFIATRLIMRDHLSHSLLGLKQIQYALLMELKFIYAHLAEAPSLLSSSSIDRKCRLSPPSNTFIHHTVSVVFFSGNFKVDHANPLLIWLSMHDLMPLVVLYLFPLGFFTLQHIF